ncbi:MAG: ribonuclease HI [Leptolyngbya sp. DLM2.Bin15]|nr:MAG: ribonuclease HI [Leptolyngbya sp. DLM2.Bin15]
MVIESLYTDGACSGNPGPGGWAAIAYLVDGGVHELGGAAAHTTNNRMEIQGAIAALDLLLSSGQTDTVTLYTDSEYVKKGITAWIKGWKRKDWKTSTGKPVVNQDLWETLDELHQQVNQQLSRPLRWEVVRGHSGNEGNERCDVIARAFSLGRSPQITQDARLMGHSAPANTTKSDKSPQKVHQLLNDDRIEPQNTAAEQEETIQSSSTIARPFPPERTMADSSVASYNDPSENLPRELRVVQLQNTVETLHMADEIAKQGYLITSAELADLMDVNASAVTSRGDNWVWRNWVVSRVRREGNQILWQLERVD